MDGVSLRAGKGETIGLLGPNGAGKTTTVSIIAGLVRPDAGEVRIAGRTLRGDTDPVKRDIGLVPQDIGLYEETVRAREPALVRRALQPDRRATEARHGRSARRWWACASARKTR